MSFIKRDGATLRFMFSTIENIWLRRVLMLASFLPMILGNSILLSIRYAQAIFWLTLILFYGVLAVPFRLVSEMKKIWNLYCSAEQADSKGD